MSTSFTPNVATAPVSLDRALSRVRLTLAMREALTGAWHGLFAGAVLSAVASLLHVFLGVAVSTTVRLALPAIGALAAGAWALRRLPREDEAAALLDRSLGARDLVVSAAWAKRALPEEDGRRARLIADSVDRITRVSVSGIMSSFEGRALLAPFAVAFAAVLLVVLEPTAGPKLSTVVSPHASALTPAIDSLREAGPLARDLRRDVEALAELDARQGSPMPAALESARRLRSELRDAVKPSPLPEPLETLRGAAPAADEARRIAERALSDAAFRDSLRAALAGLAHGNSRGSEAARDALARLDARDHAGLASALSSFGEGLAPAGGADDLLGRALVALERWLAENGAALESSPPVASVPATPVAPPPLGRTPRWALEDDAFLKQYFAHIEPRRAGR